MKRKLIVTAAAVVALAAGGAASLLLPVHVPNAEAADSRTAAPLVNLATAKLPGNSSRSFTGTVGVRVQSNLGFRVPGKIIERFVDVGEQVKAGQPLMGLDPTDLRLALTARRNAVIAAQATFVQAQADERRFATLVKTSAASSQQYERAKASLDTATAQLAAAQADANVAENEAKYAVLVADADGTIVETLGEPGQVVTAGQAVVRLAKSGPREAIVWLPETLRPDIGAQATASVYGRGDTEKATLRQISDSADQQTRTYETRWVLEGAAANAPLGATVTIEIENRDAQNHAELPIGALLDDGTRTGVWIIDQQASVVKFRDVKVERLSEENVVVTNVKPGEAVVALGAHLLKDGAPVRTGLETKEAAN
ncbi:efflux RND transporter periplasmic adaptor subunit [Agrobacterium larrymoorei]|uniref:efflux RND transporter periplasmic adaptor subunit n=1 Tax=Agrobacterium larrymoorei TaxID=160699 RepID=UPI001572A94B|nr:efflux RND transporter periplasmic adaptor subunit [Agrobacterium larrymoorei]NTJ44738.1 efflux RND transporter periplasmic adaptor subunit [Agrobacterium larrymoorei]